MDIFLMLYISYACKYNMVRSINSLNYRFPTTSILESIKGYFENSSKKMKVFSKSLENKVGVMLNKREDLLDEEDMKKKIDRLMNVRGALTFKKYKEWLEKDMQIEDQLRPVTERLELQKGVQLELTDKQKVYSTELRVINAFTPIELESNTHEVFTPESITILSRYCGGEEAVAQVLLGHAKARGDIAWIKTLKGFNIPLPKTSKEWQMRAELDRRDSKFEQWWKNTVYEREETEETKKALEDYQKTRKYLNYPKIEKTDRWSKVQPSWRPKSGLKTTINEIF